MPDAVARRSESRPGLRFQVVKARFGQPAAERSSVFVPAPAGLAVTPDGDLLAWVWSIGDRDGGTLPPYCLIKIHSLLRPLR